MFIFAIKLISDYGLILKETSDIQIKNWWKDSDEPFITNCSYFNAVICWILWLIFTFQLYSVFYMYLPTLLIALIIHCGRMRPESRRNELLEWRLRICPALFRQVSEILHGRIFDPDSRINR